MIPGKKAAGRKTATRARVIPITGPVSLLHRLDGGLLGWQSSFDVVRAVLHNDDGIVHHDADGQNQCKQGHQVYGETEGRHGNESADDGDRDGRGRNQHRPEVLQEQKNHDEHEDAGDDQGLIDAGDGLPDKFSRIVPDRIFQTLGKLLAHFSHGLIDTVGDSDGIGIRQGKNGDQGRLVTGKPRKVTEALLAQIDPGDIAQAHDLRGLARRSLDNDVFELARIGEPAEGVDRELKGLVSWHGRSAELSGDNLDILALDGVEDIRCRKAKRLEPVGVQPDPHAVGTCTSDGHLADTRKPGQRVLEINHSVIGEEDLVESIVVGVEADHKQNVREKPF